MSGGGAGTEQGAQYYGGVDAAFGGVLVTLVAEPAKSWKLSADLPDSVVLRLRCAVCGLRGVAAAASEAPTAVAVYRERLAPVLSQLPSLLEALTGPIAGKPTEECTQQLITTQQIFKLLSTVAHQPLPYLSAAESSPFYGVVVSCLSVIGQHATQPPFSEGAGDERPKVVTALVTLLSKLTTKCFVDFSEDDSASADSASNAVMDAVFTCLGFILPLISVELLASTQKLHSAFFELIPFLVEHFPVCHFQMTLFHIAESNCQCKLSSASLDRETYGTGAGCSTARGDVCDSHAVARIRPDLGRTYWRCKHNCAVLSYRN